MKRAQFRGDSAVTIAASIEEAIHGGALTPNQALPTVRALAASLRVSPVTVAAAYRQLQARGLVTSAGRRGTHVRPTPAAPLAGFEPPRVVEGLVDLATGNPDPALLPPLDSAFRSLGHEPRLYAERPLLPALAAFAAGEFASDGIPAAALTVVSGALDGIERLLREHLRAGDRIAIEDPSLPALLALVAASGYLVEPVSVDAEGPQPAEVERALARGVRAAIITPRAQNPTGAAISTARATELRRLLRRHDDLLVVENDHAGPVAGAAPVTLCDSHARWAVLRSVSKFLGPDLRVAVMAGDELTIARVRGRQALGVRWVSRLLQQLTLLLWSDPSSGRRLARAADLYSHRRAALVDALAAHGIAVTARSGFNLWIPVREETATVQFLAQRGWAVAAGERFRIRSAPAIRVTTSALEAEGARRFAADCAEALLAAVPVSA